MIALLTNLLVAIMWMMLSRPPSITSFFIGYGIGFLLMTPFAPLLGGRNYIRRVFAFVQFALIFLKELIWSNLSVAYTILFVDKGKLKPAFFEFDISDLTWLESLALSYCITLTPGCMTVDLKKTEKKLILHTLDYSNPKKVISDIDKHFKQPILRFTR